MTREALKARLMAQAASSIDALLAHTQEANEISLSEIESTAIQAGQAFRTSVLKALVEEASEGSSPPLLDCPQCHQRIQKKGLRSKQVVSAAGEVKVKRAYYYCPECHHGFFPPG
ncbi:MAG TPA: hypothetical protein VJZ27_05015 [Aggregatilineales bacterium]|nr:hypothetical protein [Aggregatilineales bacterium]